MSATGKTPARPGPPTVPPTTAAARAVVGVAGLRDVEGQAGEVLADVLHRASVPLSTSCGGRGICGTCRVRVVASAERLEAPEARERLLLGPERLGAGERLACRTLLPAGRIEIARVLESRGAGKTAAGTVTPATRPVELRQLELPPASLADPRSDWTRLVAALGGPEVRAASPALLAGVSARATAGGPLQVALTAAGELLGVLRPGQRPLGAAFDLGTSTVAAYLVDLESGSLVGVGSATNRQSRYGDDLISRSAAAPDAADELRSLAWASAFAALANAGLDDPRDLLDVVVVGNTVMHHLALSLPVDRLVRAPYTPAVVEPASWAGGLIHPALAPWARVRFPPLVAGFVGSDALVGLMEIADDEVSTLYIDIGTNAEMAVLHWGEVWACSAAAGPALEGSRLRCGSPAGPGAIVRAWLDDGDLRLHTWDGCPPRSIAGTGALSLIASLRRAGGLDQRGLLVPEALPVRLLTQVEGGRAIALAPGVVLTEADIGEVLLARAAFAAGRELLLHEAGVDEGRLERSVVAGTLGNEAAPDDLQTLGLVPTNVPVLAVGNAAGQGACRVLLDGQTWDRCGVRARQIHHVELSASPAFREAFVEQLRFP